MLNHPPPSLNRALTLLFALAPASCSDSKSKLALDELVVAVEAPSDASTSASDASISTLVPLSLFSAGATQASVRASVPGFASGAGLSIDYTFGSAGALRDRILTGTSGADVAILTPAAIAPLDTNALVHAGSRVDLAQIGGGLAVRSADALPDISDSDQFKAALLAADEIYYADPTLATAGAAFIKICATLGIADTCAAAPDGNGHAFAGGAEAMAAMALSTAATVVGATQVSEIKATPGVKLVAEYPAAPVNLQVKTTYSAFILESTSNLASAQVLLEFLGSDAFKTQLAVFGFEPASPP
jgi:molybdate transport system substrate-binding protein